MLRACVLYAANCSGISLGDWNGVRVYRPARGGRSCGHFGGCKTINRIPLPLLLNIISVQCQIINILDYSTYCLNRIGFDFSESVKRSCKTRWKATRMLIPGFNHKRERLRIHIKIKATPNNCKFTLYGLILCTRGVHARNVLNFTWSYPNFLIDCIQRTTTKLR